jgi:hypothetical protein
MGSALAIRDDVPASGLRQLARVEDNGRVACRLLAVANALDGMSRAAAARQAGMDRQTRVCGHWAYLAPFDAGGLLMLLGLLVPEGSF